MKEIVIKIGDEFYEKLIDRTKYMHPHSLYTLADAVRNGTKLPKGHGDLKDTNKIINDGISKGFCDWYDEIKYAEVLVEADKGDKE